MNRTLTLFFITFSLFINAQEAYNSKSMVVSMIDLQSSTYKKDSTANAFFIYEKGFSRMENGGNYNLLTDYEAKIKILNKQGFDHATVKVLLYRNKNNKESFNSLVAYTYNLEQGKVIKTKVEKDQIYYEKYDQNFTLVKFVFSNIKPGSVLTYKYQVESPFMYKFNGWEFQDDIPKIYSEFIADLPGNYVYNIKLVGTLKLDTRESTLKKNCLQASGYGSADCSHNIYAMKDIPAFKKEKYMTAKNNYFSRIEYELKEFKGYDGKNKKYTQTWKNVDDKLKKEATIGVQLKKLSITKNLLPDSIQSLPKDITKAKMIYRYILNNYKWNKKKRIFNDGNINKVIKDKVGNVTGINILFHNILKQQQFNVHPVLLSTRDNGYATKIHPVISDFNYLIVQLSLDGETYLLDATEKELAFGEVPFRCLNQHGRLLDFKNGSSWIDIKPVKRSLFYYKEELKLNKELKLNGKAKHISSGYHGYYKRKELDQVDKQSYLDFRKKKVSGVKITNISIKNEKDYDKPFEEEFQFIRNTETIDNTIYIKPFTLPFFKETPFKLNQRTYPVDFGYPDSYTYLVSIELPEEYEFVDIPNNSLFTIPNNLGQVGVNFQKNGKKLIITHRITFNSSYYPVEYYKILKDFFNLIIEIENDTLIAVNKVN
ncbi:uncharacterized protein DUF3857 [Aquimarina sp. MAR_2010_214]|uniref:DUF3857 domain-containing protein n=1 Tax=Aquimarina sp. MAR_2010_214 TaxID=1250026 RepID=UPI000C705392|nr:DUF3857 domain-containing protein [Aquimarina sp. MAR_2010_214]PKV52108.1 uncharacterized protein DUF3857 [Aquimarina sp. MAR_2010_214]